MSILPAYPLPLPAKDHPDEPPTPLTLAPPTRRHLLQLWRAMADDNAFHQYSDLFPHTVRATRAALDRGTLKLWVVRHGDRPVGWWSIHDRGRCADGVLGAWLGCYFVPAVRASPGPRASFPLLLDLLTPYGLTRLFVAVRVGNRPAMRFARQCGFIRIGIYDQFTVFDGAWDSVVLYTLDPADASAVWAAAERRALAVRVLLAMAGGAQ